MSPQVTRLVWEAPSNFCEVKSFMNEFNAIHVKTIQFKLILTVLQNVFVVLINM